VKRRALAALGAALLAAAPAAAAAHDGRAAESGEILTALRTWSADPPGLPRLPGLLGELQDEARAGNAARPAAAARPRVPALPGLMERRQTRRETFPSVMSLSEAALYMEVSEEDILRWIDEGRLSASRENYHYRIARSQLDELQ